ncbi:hypothetical protein J5X84_27510 [Streptosporangiaceae bacterium NEAU-GS5]|nr:hypothetical protein [Streptosporangiaceae bacterium NEAU-GS5]
MIAQFCQRLDIAGIIDRAFPVRADGYLNHEQVIEALIAHRLAGPSAM